MPQLPKSAKFLLARMMSAPIWSGSAELDLFRQSPPKFSELMSDFGRTVERYAEAIHLYASAPTSLPFAHPCNRFEVCSSSQHSSCLSSIVCCIDRLNPQPQAAIRVIVLGFHRH